jgi:hypothetical protein
VSKIVQKFGISSLLAGMARQISGTICIRTANLGPIAAAEHINDPDTASYLNLSALLVIAFDRMPPTRAEFLVASVEDR